MRNEFLDYANVVVHIFQRETRDFYRLDKLWGDADFEMISAAYLC